MRPAERPGATADACDQAILRDGSVIDVRPIRATDGPGVQALYERLPAEDLRLRFFSPLPPDRAAALAVDVDGRTRYGIIALVGDLIVGHAMYTGAENRRAEVAFTVDHDWQGRGIATILLGRLAREAAARGIHTFTASVLARNSQMLDVFRDSPFGWKPVPSPSGFVQAEFPTSAPGTPELCRGREGDAAVQVARS